MEVQIIYDISAITTNLTNFLPCKILVVVTRLVQRKWATVLEKLSKIFCRMQVLILPDYAKNTAAFRSVVQVHLQEDVKMILALGGGNVCDLLKAVSGACSVPCVLMPTVISGGGYNLRSHCCFDSPVFFLEHGVQPHLIIIYEPLIVQTPMALVVSCFGELAGFLVNILDIIDHKSQTNVGSVLGLNEIYNQLVQALQTPADLLKTPYGKLQFFQTLLSLEEKMNQFEYDGCAFHATSTLLSQNDKLSFGVAMFVSSLAIMAVYSKFFNSNVYQFHRMPSIEKHLLAMNGYPVNLMHFLKTIECASPGHFDHLLALKQVYHNMVETNQHTLLRAVKCFQQIHNDKGIFLKKIISKEMLIKTVCICEDIFGGDTLLSHLRDAGYLEFFNNKK